MHSEQKHRAHARAADPHHEAVVRASATRSKPIIAVPVPTEDEAETDRQRWLAWLSNRPPGGIVTNLDDGHEAAMMQANAEPRNFPIDMNDRLYDWNTVQGDATNSEPVIDPRDAEIEALRKRIAELEAPPVVDGDPPAEVMAEARPDEDYTELKARLLFEFASLRNMLVGHIPMTPDELARLVALEHPKYQSWLQGVTHD